QAHPFARKTRTGCLGPVTSNLTKSERDIRRHGVAADAELGKRRDNPFPDSTVAAIVFTPRADNAAKAAIIVVRQPGADCYAEVRCRHDQLTEMGVLFQDGQGKQYSRDKAVDAA